MDSIYLSNNSKVINGLRDMMDAAEDDAAGLIGCSYVDVATALLIVNIAKLAEDKPDWFPHGKWATIQNIQSLIDEQLNQLFQVRIK